MAIFVSGDELPGGARFARFTASNRDCLRWHTDFLSDPRPIRRGATTRPQRLGSHGTGYDHALPVQKSRRFPLRNPRLLTSL